MKITTLPVYSKLADEAVIPAEVQAKLPKGWQLSQHQVETYRALTEGNYDVVFNTAMTGDGKSLAAYLPALASDRHILGMYPTNELLKDQERQLSGYLKEFGLNEKQVSFCSIWGTKLAELQVKYELRNRAEILKERFNNFNALLTNPDIFSLVMNYAYVKNASIYNDQELPYSLSTNFDYLVFDEFHIFNMPQIISALTAMLYIARSSAQHHRFLFSSATMTAELQNMVQRSGLRYCEIKGDYQAVPDKNYRQVLYPAELNVPQLEKDTNAEIWLQAHVAEIVALWERCSGNAKGVIIVNSVAAARKITGFLEKALFASGITVGENTGLTDQERRKLSMTKNIVVGTSTIDVGVDFNINFLVFESTNAGTFLQRLGRLGRVRMGEAAYPTYVAHALLSPKAPWLYERLVQGLAARGFKAGEAIDRPSTLRDVVRETYPEENAFIQFAQRWGSLQGAHVIEVLENQRNNQGAYTSLAHQLKSDYANLCRADTAKTQSRYRAIAYHEERGKKILDNVLNFRGSSPFQVACWDVSVEPNALLLYDLFALLQTVECAIASKDDYLRAVQARYTDESQRMESLEAVRHTLSSEGDNPLILRITGFNEERDWLKLKSSEEFALHLDRVVVLKGFSIDNPRTLTIQEINGFLRKQSVVCYLTREKPLDLRRMLRLPPFFPLFIGTVTQIWPKNRPMSYAFWDKR